MREATRGDVRGTVSTPHTRREGEKSERIHEATPSQLASACLHRTPTTCAHSHRHTGWLTKRVSWSGRGCVGEMRLTVWPQEGVARTDVRGFLRSKSESES